MTQYVALLRGINVGGHNVKMTEMRKEFEALGLANVSTIIASGNVLFQSDDQSVAVLQQRIEAALRQRLGYGVATFLRTSQEITAISAFPAFPDMDSPGRVTHVVFLHSAAGEIEHRAVMSLNSDADSFCVRDREIYWLCRDRLSDSPVFKRNLLEKALGAPSTARNINTVRKLAVKFA